MADNSPPLYFRLSIELPLIEIERAGAVLWEHARWGWEEFDKGNSTLFTIFFPDLHQAESLQQLFKANFQQAKTELLEEPSRDWSQAWKSFFTPISVQNHFLIVPPWIEPDADDEVIPIIINPKMAFGTGHHNTTLLCLQTMIELSANQTVTAGQRFLDIGTGSGILGIAAAHLGLNGEGVDIDETAILNAQENITQNKVGSLFTVRLGSVDTLTPETSFHLIVANILSEPLIAMREQILSLLAPGGCLILSGLLREQASKVALAYQECGIDPPQTREQGEWACLFWTDITPA